MSTQTEIVVCRASYCKVFFDRFRVSEFFNSHQVITLKVPSQRSMSAIGDVSFVIGPSYVGGEQRPITHGYRSLLLKIIRVKFAIAVELNDHGTFLRRNKMS